MKPLVLLPSLPRGAPVVSAEMADRAEAGVGSPVECIGEGIGDVLCRFGADLRRPDRRGDMA